MEINDIIGSTVKVETLTIRQLLKRWPDCEEENILEWANKAHFGLYFKPSKIVLKENTNMSYRYVDKFIKTIITEDIYANDPQRKSYEHSYKQLTSFAKSHRDLLRSKPGFERLATHLETQIFRTCKSGSIEAFKVHDGILPLRHLSCFGFVIAKPDDNIQVGCISRSYYFKRKIVLEDLYIFVHEIEEFEKNFIEIKKASNQKIRSNSLKQKRSHALQEAIKSYHKFIGQPAQEIWNAMRTDIEHIEIIHEVSSWTEKDAKIQWISHTGEQRTMGRRRFVNIISKLNSNKKLSLLT